MSGEPGAGKTRLCAEFAEMAVTRDAIVLFVRTEEGVSVPFQRLTESFDHLADIAGDSAGISLGGTSGSTLGLLSALFGAPPG